MYSLLKTTAHHDLQGAERLLLIGDSRQRLRQVSLMHAGQIVLEEAAVYAVASAEVTGVVEKAAAGIVGGFAADVDAEDMDVGVHGEAVELASEFGFGHDALVPVGVEHFSREDVLIDGDVDREVERVEKVWKLARDAAIQDVILCEAADADRCGCAWTLTVGFPAHGCS